MERILTRRNLGRGSASVEFTVYPSLDASGVLEGFSPIFRVSLAGRRLRSGGLRYKVKSLRTNRGPGADVARRRRRWKAYQGRIEARLLVFLDENWIRSRLGMDGEGEQARAVPLRPQLSDRQRACDHRRCRADPGANLRRSALNKDHARTRAETVWPQAEAARRRYGLGNGQVPRLAGWAQDRAAHSGLGQGRARGRHIQPIGVRLRPCSGSMRLPGGEGAETISPQLHGPAHGQRPQRRS